MPRRKPEGPSRATRSKIAWALALLQEAVTSDGHDWEAFNNLAQAIAHVKRAQNWQRSADLQRQDMAEKMAREASQKT